MQAKSEPAQAPMLSLPAELTHRQANSVLAVLLQGLRAENGSQAVVNASALQVFDTSALAVLLECRRQMLAAQKTFTVQGLPSALAGMAVLYGVDTLLAAPTA